MTLSERYEISDGYLILTGASILCGPFSKEFSQKEKKNDTK